MSCKMDVRGRITLPLVLLPILGAVRQRNLIADVDLEVLAFLEKKEHQNVIDID